MPLVVKPEKRKINENYVQLLCSFSLHLIFNNYIFVTQSYVNNCTNRKRLFFYLIVTVLNEDTHLYKCTHKMYHNEYHFLNMTFLSFSLQILTLCSLIAEFLKKKEAL